jgi:hypothetical protein
MGLYYNQKEHLWKQDAASEGVCEDGGKWYFLTIHYGSIVRFGPYRTEDKAKIGYLENLLWNIEEQSNE